jgi:biopolymer transport protein TolR
MRKKSGLGGRKDLNADLNLTPFIDLLSTIVCFLLITAVWIEIGTVEVKQSHGTEAQESKKQTYDLDLVYKTQTSLGVSLKMDGKIVKRFDVKGNDFSEAMTNLNKIITDQVLTFQNKVIEVATATITPKSGVNYGDLISTMDVLRKNNIVNIGVLSARGEK